VFDPLSFAETDTDLTGDLQASIQDAPCETVWAFALAFLLAQVGLFAVSLGPMLAWFRGQRLLGGALFAGGCLALAGTVAVYLWHQRAVTQS